MVLEHHANTVNLSLNCVFFAGGCSSKQTMRFVELAVEDLSVLFIHFELQDAIINASNVCRDKKLHELELYSK